MFHNQEENIAQLYHLHSSNLRCCTVNFAVDVDRHPLRFRTYPGSHRVDLPGRDFNLDVSLGTVLEKRRSIREFLLKPLNLEVVGRLLHTSYGVRGYRHIDNQWTYDRPSPSAGGLYPLELYIASQTIENLADGIYHYDARAHQLELIRTGLFHPMLANMTIGQQMICDANLVIIISAIFQRTMWKYGQRGYRYVLIDAGHLGQNLYLNAIALGLGTVAIGGFFDNELNSLIGLPSEEEQIIYLACIGQPKE